MLARSEATARPPIPAPAEKAIEWSFVVAWLFVLVFYFIQYGSRSAPSVMIPELTAAFGLTALGLSSLVGLYYYTYAGFAIIAGASLDHYGAKLSLTVGVFAVAAGSVLFGLGSIGAAETGRLLQGAGSAFAFPGAILPRAGFPAAGSPSPSASRNALECLAASPDSSLSVRSCTARSRGKHSGSRAACCVLSSPSWC